MTDIASENQSFCNSIIGNTTRRITAKLITFYKTHSGLGLLISKAQVGSYIAIANDSSSLIPKPDSKFPSSKSNCTDLNKMACYFCNMGYCQRPKQLLVQCWKANNIYYRKH